MARKRRVTVDCRVYAEADTIEEAIERLKGQLNAMTFTVNEPELIDDYNHWNVENDGDVDWIPHNNQCAFSKGVLHIRND